ncbi:FtsJ-like methyltransferase-domain-containing protein [Lophiotrema nucula]|uniref:rRNA methyltransferase 2, mitochondrial n=1 Tax=Lophiotrema nucula TaxID=690887 RepID=A0A6A5YJG1_9PLEO|nr:FtsJ-like methyltransferase-domain-containing protein [Lophiotrema nucula]
MLSRRVFRQLTDGLLFGTATDIAPATCTASRSSSCPVGALSIAPRLRRHTSSSSTRWKSRQGKDFFAKEARVQGLKSRAAFKLLEVLCWQNLMREEIANREKMNEKYKLFKAGQTVVDLGYAPGSWSQVAVNRTAPNGRVLGIDLIPTQPPKGVSTIQGNFLSPDIQAEVRAYVQDPNLGRPRRQVFSEEEEDTGVSEEDLEEMERGYIDLERRTQAEGIEAEAIGQLDSQQASNWVEPEAKLSLKERDRRQGRVVDVVLSDMCEPWDQTTGYHKRSLSDPYTRMMNTSGVPFRDHAGSMDLCLAAVNFGFDTLRTGGHFLCKFYQGSEDKALETKLKRLFAKVHREKPDSSRSESKEAFFVALRRKENPIREEVFRE